MSKEFGVVEQRTWQVVTKNEHGEAEVHDLVYERKLPEVSPEDYESMFIRQAPPVQIPKTPKGVAKIRTGLTVFMGDEHYPFHDPRAIKLAMVACRALEPDVITFLGDDLDNCNFSRFESRKEWFDNTQMAIDQRGLDLARFKAGNPQAQLKQHEGNHNVRTERKIREYNGDLLGLRRANAVNELGVLSTGFLLRHDELGIEYITGYPNAEYWHTDDLMSTHGSESVSGGSTMARVIGRTTVSVVQGHTHRAELVYRTFRDGRNDKTIFGLNPGCLADFNKVPKDTYSTDQRGNIVPSKVNWQQGVAAVVETPNGLVPYLFPITRDGITVFDKTYKS